MLEPRYLQIQHRLYQFADTGKIGICDRIGRVNAIHHSAVLAGKNLTTQTIKPTIWTHLLNCRKFNNMTSLKNTSVLALLCLVAAPAWSANIDFCKVKKTYDNSIKVVPPVVTYETCSGKAFYDYAKDFVKAACWDGATDLLDGKCKESHSADATSDADHADSAAEDSPLDISK